MSESPVYVSWSGRLVRAPLRPSLSPDVILPSYFQDSKTVRASCGLMGVLALNT